MGFSWRNVFFLLMKNHLMTHSIVLTLESVYWSQTWFLSKQVTDQTCSSRRLKNGSIFSVIDLFSNPWCSFISEETKVARSIVYVIPPPPTLSPSLPMVSHHHHPAHPPPSSLPLVNGVGGTSLNTLLFTVSWTLTGFKCEGCQVVIYYMTPLLTLSSVHLIHSTAKF